MKQLLKLSFLLLVLLLPATASAIRIEIDSIYYNVEGSKATVTYEYTTVIYWGSTVTRDYYSDYPGNIVIPETITYNDTTYTVESIGPYAFNGCSRLTGIVIPNSVTSIGKLAFKGCTNLTCINIPSSVTYIGNRGFEDCTGLVDITIPNSVTDMGSSAFSGCSGLNSAIIGNSVTCINDSTFCNCTSLSNIDIPNSVIRIGNQAFVGCDGLTSIDIPNSVTSIGMQAFDDCQSLATITVDSGNMTYDSRDNCNALIETESNTLLLGCKCSTIPGTVTSIGDYAFSTCRGLTSITIPNSVTRIGYYAFSWCNNLTHIDIPNSVTSIGDAAFYSCSGLASVTIPNSVTSIGDAAFYSCSGLTSVTIPNSITSIGNRAFYRCSSLTSIDCPNSVTSIGDEAFSDCRSLTSVTIPNSVSSIGYRAFSNCTRLKDVYCYIHDPSYVTLGNNAFYLYDSWRYALRTLFIPVGSIATFQTSDWYNYFGSFVEMEEGGKVTAIELDKQTAVVIEGETLQLKAIITPEDATNKMVSWASSNPNVATVDENGVVTAMGLGNAMITAITTDGSNLSATCRVIVTSMSTTNGFAVADAEVMHGKEIVIPVAMNNDQTILAFQTDIYLPEGFGIAMDEDDEYMISPSSRLTDDHIFMANENNGTVSVVCYTPEGRPIGGNSGDDLFYITVQVPEDASGDYAIYLRNSRLTMADYTELRVPDVGAVVTVKSFIPGDANDSRTVTVTDIVVTAQYVLQMNPEPFVFEAADMNGDGDVTVTDIMLIAYLINHPTMNAPQRMPALEGGYDSMSGEDVTLMAGETRKVSVVLNNEMDYTAFQLDLTLPAGLTASNFQLTDRAGNHASDVNTLTNGKTRVLCYSPAIEAIEGHEGALLTFDVTANCEIEGSIIVDGIELVTVACQTVLMNSFTIGVNSTTSVNELNGAKTVAGVDYFNLAGQQIDRPGSGVTLVVTTYTDGTRSTTKVIK